MVSRQQQRGPGEIDPGEFRRIRREVVEAFAGAHADSRELLSQNLALAGRLHDLVREHPDFEVLHEPTPDLYRFRYVPNGLAGRQEEPWVRALLDRLNQEIVEAVRRGGRALVVTTRVRGRVVLRMPVCPQGTSEEDVDATFEALARWGRLLVKSHDVGCEKPAEMEGS